MTILKSNSELSTVGNVEHLSNALKKKIIITNKCLSFSIVIKRSEQQGDDDREPRVEFVTEISLPPSSPDVGNYSDIGVLPTTSPRVTFCARFTHLPVHYYRSALYVFLLTPVTSVTLRPSVRILPHNWPS